MSPTVEHEGVITLFRNHPRLAFDLLPPSVGIAARSVAILEADASQIVAVEARADLVLVTDPGAGPRGLVVEIQRSKDEEKGFTWPLYLTNLRARHRHDFTLLVVTMDRSVAQWAAQSIRTGHPGFNLSPVVVGPEEVPRITGKTSKGPPELAVLSALAHKTDPEVARSALLAVHGLDGERSRVYADLICTALGALARPILEGLMVKGYQYQSEFARQYFAEGEAKALQTALRTALHARYPRASFDSLLDELAAKGAEPEVLNEALANVVRAKDAPAAKAILKALVR